MAGLIPQGFIDELLSRTDIVEVIDSRVKLKKTGKNYAACCPFHNEKTPSFSVSPDKQFYHCFGCGASGNAVKFLMEYDGLSFPDSVDKLASQAGIEVPREANSQQQQQANHQPLFQLMQQASEFFQQQLRAHPQRAQAVNYFKGRGLSGQAAQFFALGYAPAGWDNLLKTLNPEQDKAITQQLISCGMLVERDDGRTYDRFRERVIFPIRDIRGRTIAFGGRVLNDEKPKYLNSPETPIFHKGNELYGLYEARQIRQKLTRFLVVEGYMDVVALAQYGIHYAVATLGTATSEQHLKRLFKLAPEIIFCFDGDSAGQKAAARAMEIVLPLLEDGVQVRFLFMPEGDDPDSLIRREGREGFERRINRATHLPEFLFDHFKAQVDIDSLHGKARFDQLVAPLIYLIPQGVLRSLIEKKLEQELGTSSAALDKLAEQGPAPLEPFLAPPEPVYEPNYPAPAATEAVSAQQPHTQPAVTSQLTPIIEKAIINLVREPRCAELISAKLNQMTLQAANPREELLLELLYKLRDNPQQESIGLLILFTGNPHQTELKRLIENIDDSTPVSSASLGTALKLMQARDTIVQEYAQLQQRLNQGESLNNDECERLRSLQKEVKTTLGRHQKLFLFH